LLCFWKYYYNSFHAFEIGNEGDEGTRILAAVEWSRLSWGHIAEAVISRWTAIHPPGDLALRTAYFKMLFGAAPDIGPVPAAMSLSIAMVSIAGLLLVAAANKIGGGVAALALSVFLFFSWNFNDLSLSGMGESTMVPFFAAQIYLLAKGIQDRSKFFLIISSLLCVVATLFRPEPIFFVPGICLALWYLNGFIFATVYGAISISFQIGRSIFSYIYYPGQMNMFNLSHYYPYSGVPAIEFFHATKFGRALLNDPFAYGLILLVILTVVGLLSQRRLVTTDGRASSQLHFNLVLVSGTLFYLVVTVGSVILGRTANATNRLAFLPTFLMMLTAALGTASLSETLVHRYAGAVNTARKVLERPFFKSSAVIVGVLLVLLAFQLETRELRLKTTARAPSHALAVKNWLVENTSPNDGVVLDFLWNRENWLGAYLARSEKFCAYYECTVSVDMGENCGWRYTACYYKNTHAFISRDRPRWLVTTTGKFSQRWLDRVRSINRMEGVNNPELDIAAWSMIYPYSRLNSGSSQLPGHQSATDTEVGPRSLTLRGGTVVQLKPAFISRDFVVYEAFYNPT